MNKKALDVPTLSLLDQLESRYKVKEEFFTVELPDGEKLKFKHLNNLTAKKALRAHQMKFMELVSNTKSVPAQWKAHLPIDPDVAAALATISFLSHEPKLSDFDAVRLHSIPAIADLISLQIQEAILEANDFADYREIEEEKKDLKATGTGNSD